MCPGIKLISTELVLIPFWLVLFLIFQISFFSHHFSLKIPGVTEQLRQDSVTRTRASNLVYTIWAVWGGFILHFLLSNYLSVLLRPSYERPVETAADLIGRDITPFDYPGGGFFIDFFADSPDPNFQEISRRLYIAKDWEEFYAMVGKVTSTGTFSMFGTLPPVNYENIKTHRDLDRVYEKWYRSTETIAGSYPYQIHLLNKKWPLKNVI